MGYTDPEKQREFQRLARARNRVAWFVGKVCARCGRSERLQLDHKDPAQKVDHKVWSWSPERREAELAKCQPLCENCHKAKTRGEQLAPCGTRSAYDRGCRCEPCRKAKSLAMADYKSRRTAILTPPELVIATGSAPASEVSR